MIRCLRRKLSQSPGDFAAMGGRGEMPRRVLGVMDSNTETSEKVQNEEAVKLTPVCTERLKPIRQRIKNTVVSGNNNLIAF